MPHVLLKDFKSKLPEVVAIAIGMLKAMVYAYLEQEVYKLIERLKRECPPPAVLIALTKKVDTLNTLISKTEKKIDQYGKFPKMLVPAIVAGKVIVEILSHMAIPSTIGTPPGPQGGVIVSVPTGKIQSASNKLVWVRKMVETLEDDVIAINSMVQDAKGVFNPLKVLLGRIDGLLARCAENPNMTAEERNALVDGIQGGNNSTNATGKGNRTDFNKDGGVPYTSKGGYVYTLSVIQEINTQTIIPRRRAIAKDFRGVTVLQGPLSFASSEEVLMDEIKFRIDNQLP
jgi:hypothetical protein